MVVGKTLLHNELGGLVNTYKSDNSPVLPSGQTLTLMPQLPDGEEDTGLWQWNTGETTRDITIATNRSFIYRVTYTNARGIESHLCFSIATKDDVTPNSVNSPAAAAATHARYYTLDGVARKHPRRGVNIIRNSTKTVFK